MTAATVYCAAAIRRTAAGLRVDATLVIITQLPAAQAIRASWLSPIEILDQCRALSISRVSGGQFNAATAARLPRARIIAELTTDCLLTNAHPMRRPVAIPSRPAITQTINQTPLRGELARSTIDPTASGPAGTAAVRRSPRPPARCPLPQAPCIRCAG